MDCRYKLDTIDDVPQLERLILKSLLCCFGFISIIAILYVCVNFVIMKNRPKLLETQAMILYLSFSDFFLSLDFVLEGLWSILFHNKICHHNLCWVMALLSQYFSLASFLWTACMSHTSYTTVRNIFSISLHNHQAHQNPMIRYNLICWGIPAVSVLITAAVSSPQECGQVSEKLWANAMFYLLPLIALEAYNIYVYRFLAKTLRLMPMAEGDAVFNRFKRYMFIVVWTRAMFLLNRGQVLFPGFSGNETATLALVLVSSLGAPLQGLGDAAIFRGDFHSSSRTDGDSGAAPVSETNYALVSCSSMSVVSEIETLRPFSDAGVDSSEQGDADLTRSYSCEEKSANEEGIKGEDLDSTYSALHKGPFSLLSTANEELDACEVDH